MMPNTERIAVGQGGGIGKDLWSAGACTEPVEGSRPLNITVQAAGPFGGIRAGWPGSID